MREGQHIADAGFCNAWHRLHPEGLQHIGESLHEAVVVLIGTGIAAADTADRILMDDHMFPIRIQPDKRQELRCHLQTM